MNMSFDDVMTAIFGATAIFLFAVTLLFYARFKFAGRRTKVALATNPSEGRFFTRYYLPPESQDP
jgi:hypothetical protein